MIVFDYFNHTVEKIAAVLDMCNVRWAVAPGPTTHDRTKELINDDVLVQATPSSPALFDALNSYASFIDITGAVRYDDWLQTRAVDRQVRVVLDCTPMPGLAMSLLGGIDELQYCGAHVCGGFLPARGVDPQNEESLNVIISDNVTRALRPYRSTACIKVDGEVRTVRPLWGATRVYVDGHGVMEAFVDGSCDHLSLDDLVLRDVIVRSLHYPGFEKYIRENVLWTDADNWAYPGWGRHERICGSVFVAHVAARAGGYVRQQTSHYVFSTLDGVETSIVMRASMLMHVAEMIAAHKVRPGVVPMWKFDFGSLIGAPCLHTHSCDDY